MRVNVFFKIFLVILPLALIPGSVVWYLQRVDLREQIQQQFVKEQHAFTARLVGDIGAWIDQNRRSLQLAAELPDMRSLVAERQRPLLQALVFNYPWNYVAFAIDPQGDMIASSDGVPLHKFGDRQFAQDIWDGSPFASQLVVERASGRLSLVMAAPITPGDPGAPGRGVLAIATTLDDLTARVIDQRFGETGGVYLVDAQARLIAGSPYPGAAPLDDLSAHPALHKLGMVDGSPHYATQHSHGAGAASDTATVSAAHPLPNGWWLVVEQDWTEAYAPLSRANRQAAWQLVATLLVTAVAAYLIALRIAQPLRNLRWVASRLARGEEPGRLREARRGDEVGALARQLIKAAQGQVLLNRLAALSLREAPLDDLLKAALGIVLSADWLPTAPQGIIFLCESGRPELKLGAHHGLPERALETCATVPMGHCLCGRAAQHGVAELVEHVEEPGALACLTGQPRGQYHVPLLADGELEGVMIVFVEAGHRRDEMEMQFLQAAGQTLGGILQRRRAEQAVVAAERQLEAVLDNSPAVIYLKDTDGRYRLVNRAFEILFALSRESVIGRSDLDIFPRAMATAYRANDVQVAREGRAHEFEEVVEHDGGPRDYLSVKFPLRDERGAVYAVGGISADITERKEMLTALREARDTLEQRVAERTAELIAANAGLAREKAEQQALIRKLEQAHNQLLQSEKLASIGQLAAGVAHEINNPVGFVSSNLNSLRTYVDDLLRLLARYEALEHLLQAYPEALQPLQTLKEEIDLAFLRDDIGALVEQSLEGTGRVKKIVADLKDFARSGSEERVWADLNQCLESTLNVVWNELKYKARVVRELGAIPDVRCVPSQLNQVFMNLLVNAAQAIEQSGTITVRTAAEGDYVRVEVEDTGRGIPPDRLERIFDPFYTTKPVGKGTGLGLSISYGIVERHGGTIEVVSEAGKGSRFTVLLPIVPTEEAPAGAPATAADNN